MACRYKTAVAHPPTSLRAAQAAVLAEVVPLPFEQVALEDALGRVLAEDLSAVEPVPGLDNSAMDGYALRSADTAQASAEAAVALRLSGESRAGGPADCAIARGEAARISTGAALPQGADAVVRQEDVTLDGDRVVIHAPVPAGHDVRRAGEDVAAGSVVLARGAPIGPAELGVAASLGLAAVPCARQPVVHAVTTGDELVAPGEPRGPAGVWNSNALTVPAQARLAGALTRLAPRVPDSPAATLAAVGDGLEADVLVVCGGVSVGPHDHVKAAFAAHGVEERFWRIAFRPGGPTWFGVSERGDLRTLVFGLPGNPVSAMVTFHLLVRPALRALQGATEPSRATTAILDEDVAKRPGRLHALRCHADLREDGWHVRPTGPQGSHVLTSMLGADALAMLPEDSDGARAGERVVIELLG
jgi:molybdopterin molybdotransferase